MQVERHQRQLKITHREMARQIYTPTAIRRPSFTFDVRGKWIANSKGRRGSDAIEDPTELCNNWFLILIIERNVFRMNFQYFPLIKLSPSADFFFLLLFKIKNFV